MEVKGNPLWALAEAIQCDNVSNMFACVKQCESVEDFEPHKDTDSCDSSIYHDVAVIYAMLRAIIESFSGGIQRAVLVASASFNSATIVRAILADNAANGVEWSDEHERALEIACTEGHVESAELIACGDDGQVKSMLDQSLALRYYCLAGDMKRAREILTSDTQAVAIEEALVDACKHGRCDVVTLLTADARFDPFVDGKDALEFACTNGHVELVSMLLRDNRWPNDSEIFEDALHDAVVSGHCDVVALMVQDSRVNPGLNKSFALEQYCLVGDVERAKEVLHDPDFVAAPVIGELLPAASSNGHASIVQFLLTDPRVDPAADDNCAIRYASSKGHVSIVKLFLADPRVDPAAKNNGAISTASFCGHVDVVKLLLADPRVDPRSTIQSSALGGASFWGHANVVKLLLADPRVDPSFGGQAPPLKDASRNGHANVVKLLLADRRVVVTKEVLMAADKQDHGDVIRLLIDKQPRVLFESAIGCKSGGALEGELRRREKASALALLLAMERAAPELRVSDVLRDVVVEYACCDVIDVREVPGYFFM